jgi:hypothetical protein
MPIDVLDAWHLRLRDKKLECEFCKDSDEPIHDRTKIKTYRKLLQHTNDIHIIDKIERRHFFKKLTKIVEEMAEGIDYDDLVPNQLLYG